MEKKDNKWLLVDPEGNVFFYLGICVFGPVDDYTYVVGREDIYEWLPSLNSEFKTAFRENGGNSKNVAPELFLLKQEIENL